MVRAESIPFDSAICSLDSCPSPFTTSHHTPTAHSSICILLLTSLFGRTLTAESGSILAAGWSLFTFHRFRTSLHRPRPKTIASCHPSLFLPVFDSPCPADCARTGQTTHSGRKCGCVQHPWRTHRPLSLLDCSWPWIQWMLAWSLAVCSYSPGASQHAHSSQSTVCLPACLSLSTRAE